MTKVAPIELGCQNIFLIGFHGSGLVFILLHPFLNAVKNLLWNYSCHTAGNYHVAVTVLTGITAVFKQVVHTCLVGVFVFCVGENASII